ncbi:hypothetical protein [Streptomyces abyssomicinicus]|nr:hypothetical protein [Streptomyces abyssomicinicus]
MRDARGEHVSDASGSNFVTARSADEARARPAEAIDRWHADTAWT